MSLIPSARTWRGIRVKPCLSEARCLASGPEVTLVEEKRHYGRGKATRLLRAPARSRSAPRCPHFTRCGGFQWQPKTRELHMGFRQEVSNDLVASRACPILAPELEALLLPLRDCLGALKAAS